MLRSPQSPLTARRAAEIDMRLPTTRATQTALTAPEGKSLRTRITCHNGRNGRFAFACLRPSAVLAKNYGATTFVTGMRAYAATAVVLTHSGGAGLRDLGSIGNHLTELGAQGVTVFFVISGFSVATSRDRSESFIAIL